MSDHPRALLLDTCALIWVMNGEPIDEDAKQLMTEAMVAGRMYVHPMSAWKIGMLVSKNRLSLSMPTPRWFKSAVSHPGLSVLEMSIEALIESTDLPGDPPKDPIDRMMIASARDMDMTLVTRDGRILSFSKMGYVKTLTC